MLNIEYPSIQGKTEREQLAEIKAYLFQLADTLNYIINTLEANQSKGGKA